MFVICLPGLEDMIVFSRDDSGRYVFVVVVAVHGFYAWTFQLHSDRDTVFVLSFGFCRVSRVSEAAITIF